MIGKFYCSIDFFDGRGKGEGFIRLMLSHCAVNPSSCSSFSYFLTIKLLFFYNYETHFNDLIRMNSSFIAENCSQIETRVESFYEKTFHAFTILN